MLAKILALVAIAAPMLVAGADSYVHTPQGRIRSDCVHKVPSGSVLRADPDSGRLHHYNSAGVFVREIPLCDNQKERPMFEHTAKAHHQRIRLAATGPDTIVKDDPLPADYDGASGSGETRANRNERRGSCPRLQRGDLTDFSVSLWSL